MSTSVKLLCFQRIYAFALTPGQVQVGRVSVLHPMDMIRYRIVEGGEAEIEVDEKNGQLTYKGPQTTQSKNYTLKVDLNIRKKYKLKFFLDDCNCRRPNRLDKCADLGRWLGLNSVKFCC